MDSKTASIYLNASQEDVFDFLSKEENLPLWATEFCKELKKENGIYKVVSPLGELFFEIKSDKTAGKIDMHYGPAKDKMAILSTSVVDVSANSSKFECTCFKDPSMSNEVFDSQFESLRRELDVLKKHFS